MTAAKHVPNPTADDLLASSRQDAEATARIIEESEPEFMELRRWLEVNHIAVKIGREFRGEALA